jgi:O-antigen ligase
LIFSIFETQTLSNILQTLLMKPQRKLKKKEVTKPRSLLFYIMASVTILFIPVFHVTRALDQAMMPRTLVLSFFVLVMAIVLMGNKNYRYFDFSVFKRCIFPVLGAYLSIVAISILFTINYKESFYDIVRTFLLLSTTGIAALIFIHTDNWQYKLPKFVIIAAIIALIIGSVQYFNHVMLAENLFLPDGRLVLYKVTGLMFHKNEYSTALLLMLPFIGYAIYIYRGAWKITAFVTALLILSMIILVQTRAVWVGFAIAFFIIALVYMFYARALSLPRLYRNILSACMITGLLGIAVIFSMEKPRDPNSLLGRVRSITDTRSQHNIHRLNIWKSTINLIKERPVTGTGAGNWRLHAAYYYDGRFDQVPQLNWARPHNDFLWVFAEKGIFGFLFYLAIFGFAIYYLLSIIKRSNKIEDKILALLFIAAIVAYLAVSFFSFPYERINHQIYLALMIGATTSMYHKLMASERFKPKRLHILLPVIVFSVFGIAMSYYTIKQEMYLNKALGAMKNENWRAYLHNAQLAVNPFKSLDPLSNPPKYYEGMALAKLNRHHEAITAYEQAREQFPNNMWILNWMGQSYYQVGRYEEAIDCLNHVIKIIPSHKEAHINLSATYFKMGDYQSSYDALKQIKNWQDDSAILSNMRALENMMKREANNR